MKDRWASNVSLERAGGVWSSVESVDVMAQIEGVSCHWDCSGIEVPNTVEPKTGCNEAYGKSAKEVRSAQNWVTNMLLCTAISFRGTGIKIERHEQIDCFNSKVRAWSNSRVCKAQPSSWLTALVWCAFIGWYFSIAMFTTNTRNVHYRLTLCKLWNYCHSKKALCLVYFLVSPNLCWRIPGS